MRNGKLLFLLLAISCANGVFAQAKKYLDAVGKYNEATLFEDSRYASITWQQFYALEEANELVDPVNYDYDLMNAAVFFAVNKYRESRGLSSFRFDAKLRDAAAIHSAAMVNQSFFSHENARDPALRKVENRVQLCGFTGGYWAENISRMYQTMDKPKSYKQLADEMVYALSLSKGHNENMLDKTYKLLGCALTFEKKASGNSWYYRSTQDFGAE